MYLQLSYLLFRLHMEIRSRYLCVKITSGLLILYNKPYQTNYTENEMDGQVYQQPSEENNLLSPHHREEATDPNEQVLWDYRLIANKSDFEQPQYADMAIRNLTPGETIPKQAPDAGLGDTVHSTINHTGT